MNSEVIIRHHERPRTTLYVPKEEELPFSLKSLDVFRHAETDLDEASLRRIDDLWTEGEKQIDSHAWRGKTVFIILQPRAPQGKVRAGDGVIRQVTTSRPPMYSDHLWTSFGKSIRKALIKDWEEQKPKVEAARESIGIGEAIDFNDVDEYEKVMKTARAEYAMKTAPAMPVIKVYDERLLKEAHKSMSAIGFATINDRLIRHHDTNI